MVAMFASVSCWHMKELNRLVCSHFFNKQARDATVAVDVLRAAASMAWKRPGKATSCDDKDLSSVLGDVGSNQDKLSAEELCLSQALSTINSHKRQSGLP